MVIILLMAMRQDDMMGRFVLPRALWAMGWLCTGALAIAVAIMFCELVRGPKALRRRRKYRRMSLASGLPRAAGQARAVTTAQAARLG
jgi:hypothetical protein